MIALPIISIVCCVAYIVFVLFKYGVPVSISETYYLLPNKWDWLFSAWTVLTAVPFGLYWYQVAPDGLKWMPISVVIAMLMIGVADCYKSGPKKEDCYDPLIVRGDYITDLSKVQKVKPSWWQRLVEYVKTKFNPKMFFKFGLARFLHYTNSLFVIIVSTVYIIMTAGTAAIISTVLLYVAFIVVGLKTDGVYNPDYSLDTNNSTWTFNMEVVCFVNLFTYVLA